MFYQSLMAGWSRGFTLMSGSAEEATVPNADVRPDEAVEEARRSDLVAALRFPMAPDWILRGPRRLAVAEVPPLRPAPRGCG
jgi:hypothetical protein